MKRDYKIVTSIWFIIGLSILLLNDFIFKDLYGNWLTGKLSDFAGLFVFSLFWTAIFPMYKFKIFMITGLFFIFWKSSLSHPFIDVWNSLDLFAIDRVVDYTDLFALIILPLGYIFESEKDWYIRVKVYPVFPLLLSAFAFIATSYSTEVKTKKVYEFDLPKETLEMRLSMIGSINRGYGVKLTDANPDTIEFSIQYDLCFDSFNVKVVVEEITSMKTKMTLIEVSHSCPKEDVDEEEAMEAFEELIIEKIKNVP